MVDQRSVEALIVALRRLQTRPCTVLLHGTVRRLMSRAISISFKSTAYEPPKSILQKDVERRVLSVELYKMNCREISRKVTAVNC